MFKYYKHINMGILIRKLESNYVMEISISIFIFVIHIRFENIFFVLGSVFIQIFLTPFSFNIIQIRTSISFPIQFNLDLIRFKWCLFPKNIST